jgi:translocator protein
VATTVAMVAGNIAATSLPLFGRSTGEVADRYPVLVTPAGYVFSIWGLIYLAMLAYSAAQFISPLSEDPLIDRLAAPVIVSNIANVTWLVMWHALYVWASVAVMLVLLGSLVAAYVLARRGRPSARSALERWAVRVPLSLYLGWVSVATIANVASALYDLGWTGAPLAAEWWAVIMIAVAGLLAAVGVARERDVVFAGVFVWALAGIAVEQEIGLVVWSAAAVAVAVTVAAAIALASRARSVTALP